MNAENYHYLKRSFRWKHDHKRCCNDYPFHHFWWTHISHLCLQTRRVVTSSMLLGTASVAAIACLWSSIVAGNCCNSTPTVRLYIMTSSNGNISASLALCAGNSPVTDEFPAQRSATQSFDDFFDLRLNQQLNKQWWRRWFETPSRSLWRHCNELSRWRQDVETLSVFLALGEGNPSLIGWFWQRTSKMELWPFLIAD